MAGDWIKMRGNLWDDPRVASLCDLTDSPEAMIVGGLYWLWATADQHSEDGVMPGLTLRSIDRKTGIQGFGQALCDIGWLADHPEGVRIVRFDEHNGISAKRRSTDAQRKSAVRGGEPATRKYITAGVKAKVFAIDGFKCVYCGRHKDDQIPANLNPAEFALSVDHLTPVSQGGDNSEENLVTACLPCNMSKNGRTPDEWGVVPDLSERIRTQQRQNAPKCGARERVRKEKEETPLSGKPDAEPDSPAGLLAYLNAKAGKAFRPVESNLGRIAARLKTCSPDDVRAVIDTQVEKWGRDEKMTEYLRPETLFGALKFEGYLGNLPAASAHAAPGGEPDSWRKNPMFAGVL